jgi:hypothetical protein
METPTPLRLTPEVIEIASFQDAVMLGIEIRVFGMLPKI